MRNRLIVSAIVGIGMAALLAVPGGGTSFDGKDFC